MLPRECMSQLANAIMPATWSRLNGTLASRWSGRLRRYVSKRNGQRHSTMIMAGSKARNTSALLPTHDHDCRAGNAAWSIADVTLLNDAFSYTAPARNRPRSAVASAGSPGSRKTRDSS
jgi:hypothetical protein